MADTMKAKPAEEKKVSKMEAVRRALAKFGPETKPTEIANYIKKNYGVVLSNDRISNYKSEILRKGKKDAKQPAAPAPAAVLAPKPITPVAAPKPVAKPAPVQAVAAQVKKSPPAPVAVKSESGISLKDIQLVKDLVARVGPQQLKGLIEVMAH